LCHDKFSKVDRLRFWKLCYLTARQYGEVVLPDAASGHSPGTLATKLSLCKEGLARFLASRYKFLLGLRVSRYKFVLGAGAIKNRDKLIDPTVRVRLSNLFSLTMLIFKFIN
jgi:hypothetical protein